MSRYINRRTILGTVLVVVLGIFVPPLINVGRFRGSVADALSRALGRPVSVAEVHLRLFPWPGLDLRRVVVQDDPAFSAEPLLRADEVTAAFRLTSLWRGRLEIARLSFSYPSLNLVRAPSGHWNLESLLERARQTPTAPTSKRSAGVRTRFPYVEASGGRINLKLGQEKTVYALSNANFALSSPSEDLWRFDVAANPVRTDANLSDTGSVRLSGTVQRAATLSDTPVNLQLVLNGAQLGQLTKLIYGRDRGWRGTVHVSASVHGTPAALKIAADTSISDFRRYDIAIRGSLRLAARCSGAFSTVTQDLTDIACHAPVGNGSIELHGGVSGVLPPRSYSLTASATGVPAVSVLELARRMKKNLPDDLQASGTLTSEFTVRNNGGGTVWSGSGTTSALNIRSQLLSAPLALGELHLAWGLPAPARGSHAAADVPPSTLLRVSPFPVELGGTAPAKAQAWFARDGYHVDLQGDALLRPLLQVAHAFGVPVPEERVSGSARIDLQISGAWTGFAAPVVTGNLHLHGVTAAVPGFAAPLQLSTAALHLAPDAAALYDMSGSFTGTHLSFTGSVQVPRACTAKTCPIAFQLRADQLSTDELNRLLNPRAQKRPWYDILGERPRPSVLAKVDALGRISAARLNVKTLSARHVSGDVRLASGVLTIRNLRAQVFGGSGTAELRADFTGPQPLYEISGAVQQASVASVAAITRGAWATGRTEATYRITASGWDAAQLRQSAVGTAAFDWRDGSLTGIALTGSAAPLKLRRFQGQLKLDRGQISFPPSRMETPAGIYVVSGTASLDRKLALRITRGKTEGYDVTGTVEKPLVKPAALPVTERAAMKP